MPPTLTALWTRNGGVGVNALAINSTASITMGTRALDSGKRLSADNLTSLISWHDNSMG